jgi:CubicO group peptidase (beta-lactamase class C family)
MASVSALPDGVRGECDPRYAAVADLLARQLESGEHHGVAVSVFERGRPVVDAWGGRRRLASGGEADWDERTMAVSFSTTKGVAATALHMVLERAGVGYETPVAEIWPGFGKRSVTIRHVLCHEAGVPQIRDQVPGVEAMADWEAMVAMMERLEPLWEPGTRSGYHAVNFGWMVGELLRRLDGRDISAYLAEEVAGPLGLDGAFIGTPLHEQERVAVLERAKVKVGTRTFADSVTPGSLTERALGPRGDLMRFMNTPGGLSMRAPAIGGVFTARSLARLYAALERGGELGGTRLLSTETLERATAVQSSRRDLVLLVPVRWRLGFMSGGAVTSSIGPHREAFGHSGWGGSVALADPRSGVAMALVLDRLEPDLLGGARTLELVRTVLGAAS